MASRSARFGDIPRPLLGFILGPTLSARMQKASCTWVVGDCEGTALCLPVSDVPRSNYIRPGLRSISLSPKWRLRKYDEHDARSPPARRATTHNSQLPRSNSPVPSVGGPAGRSRASPESSPSLRLHARPPLWRACIREGGGPTPRKSERVNRATPTLVDAGTRSAVAVWHSHPLL